MDLCPSAAISLTGSALKARGRRLGSPRTSLHLSFPPVRRVLLVAVLAVVMGWVVTTWWAWTLAVIGLVLFAAIAWVPRLGPWALERTRWTRLPRLGVWRGWRASLALLAGALVLLIAGSSIAPGPSTTALACSPKPCAQYNGLQLTVTKVERNWSPPGRGGLPAPTPRPGFSYVRVQFELTAKSGEHEFSSGQLRLKDALGFEQRPETVSFFELIEEVITTVTGATIKARSCELPSTRIAQGGQFGPKHLCFQVGGSPHGALLLLWQPRGAPWLEIPLN